MLCESQVLIYRFYTNVILPINEIVIILRHGFIERDHFNADHYTAYSDSDDNRDYRIQCSAQSPIYENRLCREHVPDGDQYGTGSGDAYCGIVCIDPGFQP